MSSVSLIPDSTAAIIAYFFKHSKIYEQQYLLKNSYFDQKWLVIDIGAGTSDISLINVKGLKQSVHDSNIDWDFKTIKISGCQSLGGQDLTSKLYDVILSKIHCSNIPISTQYYQLFNIANSMKIHLSNHPYSVYAFDENKKSAILISRSEFEHCISDQLQLFQRQLSKCLSLHGSLIKNLHVLFIGLSSKIPSINKLIRSTANISTVNCVHKDNLVAIGSSLVGCIKYRKYNNLSYTLIAPYHIGVKTIKNPNSPLIYQLEPLISSGSVIPFAYNYTDLTNSGSFRIDCELYEGNNKIVSDNYKLGNMSVVFNKPQRIHSVTLVLNVQLDSNGCLFVHASCQHSETKESIKCSYLGLNFNPCSNSFNLLDNCSMLSSFHRDYKDQYHINIPISSSSPVQLPNSPNSDCPFFVSLSNTTSSTQLKPINPIINNNNKYPFKSICLY